MVDLNGKILRVLNDCLSIMPLSSKIILKILEAVNFVYEVIIIFWDSLKKYIYKSFFYLVIRSERVALFHLSSNKFGFVVLKNYHLTKIFKL